MKPDSRLASQIAGKGFVVTVEYLPRAGTSTKPIEQFAGAIGDKPAAVNVADNHYGVEMSSLAASVAFICNGKEPILQMITRDRNRIALQSDLLGAASLGVKNVLCLSGYHQALMGNPESANVFDVDTIQLIVLVKNMNDGQLLDGTKIDGPFSMLIGAVANPGMRPLELNLIRLDKKIRAGADFVQTQAVFDISAFQEWLEEARAGGITDEVAILAGVLPLKSAEEARKLAEAHTDFRIPKAVIERLAAAGNAEAQKKEGLAICVETIKKLKTFAGLKGVHVLSMGDDSLLPEILAAI